MNLRKFTIIDSDTQRTSVIESSAETVAELKRDLRSNGFSVEGKTIQEGLTRIEFKSDDAVLPHDVPRNGTVTNDLVFRLTKSQKNIKSGNMTRPEAYAKVKELGLGDAIKQKYGKNFTQCSTADLVAEIEKATKKPAPKAETKTETPVHKEEAKVAPINSDNTVAAIVALTSALVNNGSLSAADGKNVADILGVEIKGSNTVYSQAELDRMFNGM